MTRLDNRGPLRRQRLERQLDAASLGRLTVLTAGAGFGKTTLLTQCFAQRNAVWHTLTEADRSFPLLARSVIRGLRLLVPTLSTDLIAAVEGAWGPDAASESNRPIAIAGTLAEDLESHIERDLVLVFDDVHALGDEGDSVAFIAALCRLAPERLRIVTASRAPLPFPVSRLAVSGTMLHITAEDLLFTRDEVAALVEGGGGAPAVVDGIMELTGGWPAPTALSVRIAGKDPALPAVPDDGRAVLLDYLAEEALVGEDPSTIDALRVVSLLPWFTPELLTALGTDSSSVRALVALGSPWLVPMRDARERSTVSPLVGEFVAARHPVPAEEQARLLARAARWYRGSGSDIEALGCFVAAGDADGLVELLREAGSTIVATGGARQVLDAIESLPHGTIPSEITILEAQVVQMLGDWEGAIRRYGDVLPAEGPISATAARHLGFLYHMRGDLETAIGVYERGMLVDDTDPAEAALLGWLASAYWLRGERDRASELAKSALERAKGSADASAMATAHTVLAMVAALDGDREGNDRHYLRALEFAEQANDVVQTIRIRSNRGSHFLEEGAYGAALDELDIALRLAQVTGFVLWRGMTLSNRAQVNGQLGKLEEAVADLVEARRIFRNLGSRLEAYPLVHLGQVYTDRGDTARAADRYREAITLSREQHDLQALVPALAGLARLVAESDPDTARLLADEATSIDSVMGRVSALVAAGYANLHGGDLERARNYAVEATEAAAVRNDAAGLAEALELSAAIPDAPDARSDLAKARALWVELSVPVGIGRVDLALAGLDGGREGVVRARSAASMLRRNGASGLALRAANLAETLTREEARGLTIRTLGGFAVVVEGAEVPLSAWQSRVAREVVWMLIANRFRPIHREVLIERLWPDDDPARTTNRLSVALTTIRKIFDPARIHDQDYYLRADRETVMLVREHVTVDVEVFLDKAALGHRLDRSGSLDDAAAAYVAAELVYVGDFLEEQPYADWAILLREEARSEYMAIASRLAEIAEHAGDDDAAARRYLRMLERDPYDESAHMGLIGAMERTGRRGTARRLYGTYVGRMTELDVEPAPFPGDVVERR
ncbi:MAG: tetratricopeptide repeat protein [Acidimicrobiia bacterium]